MNLQHEKINELWHSTQLINMAVVMKAIHVKKREKKKKTLLTFSNINSIAFTHYLTTCITTHTNQQR